MKIRTLLKPIYARNVLLDKNIPIFSPEDFAAIFGLNEPQTKRFLEKYVKEGLFFRLKKGLYLLTTDHSIPEGRIANALYAPSYISFEFALAYWNIIPETVYTITSATTKPSRLFTVKDIAYSYLSLKKEAFTGYSLIGEGNDSFLMADKEKALADYLYFVALGKKSLNDRFDLDGLDKDKVLSYLELFKRKTAIEIFKNI